jgi:hypothetical protein
MTARKPCSTAPTARTASAQVRERRHHHDRHHHDRHHHDRRHSRRHHRDHRHRDRHHRHRRRSRSTTPCSSIRRRRHGRGGISAWASPPSTSPKTGRLAKCGWRPGFCSIQTSRPSTQRGNAHASAERGIGAPAGSTDGAAANASRAPTRVRLAPGGRPRRFSTEA